MRALAEFVALVDELLPWLFAPVPLLWLVALLIRRRLTVVVAAVPTLAFVALYGGQFWPRRASAPPGVDVRVMTFNLGWTGVDAVAAARVIRESGADVVALQELTPAAGAALERELATTYPHRYVHPSEQFAWGRALLSRHPVIAESASIHSQRSVRIQRAELRVGGRRLHVLSLHLSPPAAKWLFRPPLLRGIDRGEQLADLDEVVPIVRELRDQREAVVLLGDLNAGERSATYRRLIDLGLADAHRAAGSGFGLTFPARPLVSGGFPLPPVPAIRIDHVFVSPGIAVMAARPLSAAAGSDHFPVVADLRIVS